MADALRSGSSRRRAGLIGRIRDLHLQVRRWRGLRRTSPWWSVTATVIALFLALPIVTIIWLALRPGPSIWPHLLATVLPSAMTDTVLLLTGAGIVSAITGTATAWLVTMYRFPGRATIDRMLVLPLAIPAYITAYAYVELLDYAGPVQSALRAAAGYSGPRDYFFPEIRSLGGAVFIMSASLYPYVYLAARASFVQQSVCALEVARTLGCTPFAAFRNVAFPMARPALAAGIALVLMECLNDLGAVQYLGVQTLSASIYATWLQRSNLGGAAQLSLVALALIVLIVIAERWARRGGRVHNTTGRNRAVPFETLEGWKAAAALTAAMLPVIAGFVVPVLVIGQNVPNHIGDAFASGFADAVLNSLVLSGLVAAIAVIIALVLAYARRLAQNRATSAAANVASFGYALPGTVLAIGTLIPFAAFDNGLDAWARQTLGVSTGLILSGTLVAVTAALLVRFFAVALGSVDAGLARVSPNLDAAARALGLAPLSVLRRVHVRLLLPAIGAAALLVFVDSMKELPATLLLRPFNFETLATHVYSLVAIEQFEQASLGAATIVVVGLLPVLLLHQAVANGRAGS